MQNLFAYDWIPSFKIQYLMGTDGISFPLIVLTACLSVLAMGASWPIKKYERAYCVLFLLLETGMLGVFCALDFFLFYVFWEVMLLPMYFLIGIWGGPRKEYAAIKFFLYTLLGSVLMLIAILMLYFNSDFGNCRLPDFGDWRRQPTARRGSQANRRSSDPNRPQTQHTFNILACSNWDSTPINSPRQLVGSFARMVGVCPVVYRLRDQSAQRAGSYWLPDATSSPDAHLDDPGRSKTPHQKFATLSGLASSGHDRQERPGWPVQPRTPWRGCRGPALQRRLPGQGHRQRQERGADVKQVVAKVRLGEADAAGSSTRPTFSARSPPTSTTFAIPDAFNTIADCPIAQVTGAAQPDLARAFMAMLVGARARRPQEVQLHLPEKTALARIILRI